MFKHRILPFVGLLSLAACSSDSFQKSPTGLEYKFFIEKKSDKKAEVGDMISFHVIVKNSKDSILQNTHTANKVDSLLKRSPQPATVEVKKPSFKGDLAEGLMMMSEGDSAIFNIPVDSLYKGAPAIPPMLKKGEKLSFIVAMKKISKASEQRGKEEKLIDSTLSAAPAVGKIEKTASGMRYVITNPGNGTKPNPGDMIGANHFVTLLNDTATIVNSFGKRAMLFPLGNAQAQGGLPAFYDEATALLNYGGEGMFYIPSKLAFGSEGLQGIVPPNAVLVAKLALLSKEEAQAQADKTAKEQAEAQQKQADAAKNQDKIDQKVIADFVKKKGLKNVQKTASGLHYIVTSAGKGAKPAAGDKVSVHYKGTLLDGKVFDSSEGKDAFSFTLGQMQVIRGWDEGIALLNEGSKAQLIIPSQAAYGAQGAGGDIPANSVLFFEVELVKVEKAK